MDKKPSTRLPSFLTFGAGILGALGTLMRGETEARVSGLEASLLDRERRAALTRLSVRLAQMQRAARRREGARKAAFAASGLKLEGSAVDVLADAAREEAIAQAIAEMEGKSLAYRASVRAAAARARGKAARRGSLIAGAARVLGAFGGLYRGRF